MLFHTFYTHHIPDQVVSGHNRTCARLEVDITYHTKPFTSIDQAYKDHGDMMTSVLHEAKSDEVVRFLDIDCIPYDINVLKRVDEFCEGVKTFAGNAQNVSHLKNRNNLYAAASMLMVHKERWVQMGSPFLTWYMDGRCNQIDTAQRLTLIADEWGLPYRLLYPIGYDSQPEWILGSFGVYGRGTKYPGTWHYGRISDFAHDVPELWSKRVDDVMSGADIVPSKMSQFY